MRVSAELKNLIKRNFDEKRAKVRNEIKSMSQGLYEDKKKEIASSKEFKAYVKASKALYERFQEDSKKEGNYYDGNTPYRLHIDRLKDVKIEDIIVNNINYYSEYNKELQTNIGKEIETLDLAQESLMIKLTYERDLDKIREMLAEYEIFI